MPRTRRRPEPREAYQAVVIDAIWSPFGLYDFTFMTHEWLLSTKATANRVKRQCVVTSPSSARHRGRLEAARDLLSAAARASAPFPYAAEILIGAIEAGIEPALLRERVIDAANASGYSERQFAKHVINSMIEQIAHDLFCVVSDEEAQVQLQLVFD